MDLCGAWEWGAGNCHSGEIEESKIFHFFFHLSIMNLILSMSASITYQSGKLEFQESSFSLLILCALLLYQVLIVR